MARSPKGKSDWQGGFDPGFPVSGRRGMVVGIGGASDIVLAKLLARQAIMAGANSVDIVQVVAVESLAEKVPDERARSSFALRKVPGASVMSLLRHVGRVPNKHGPLARRGKGLQVSAAMSWSNGERYVVSSKGGFSNLKRLSAKFGGYGFVMAVDGGGDILSGRVDEFDVINLNELSKVFVRVVPMCLYVIGIGADGHLEGRRIKPMLQGWRVRSANEMPRDFSVQIQSIMTEAGRWHPAPRSIGRSSRLNWRHGPHVPQIVAVALRNGWPAATRCPGMVRVWRRGGYLAMQSSLLRSIWVLRPIANKHRPNYSRTS